MEHFHHRFAELFAQLGLPSDEEAIRAFLRGHAPLPDGVRLEDAPFWNAAQSDLLRQELREDADWAEVVDRLNAALHAH